MSSEEIIRQIIKGIVTNSNAIFKNGLIYESKIAENEAGREDNTDREAVKQLFRVNAQFTMMPYQVSDTLAAFMLRAVVLDPANEFQIEREFTRQHVDKLIQVLVE